MKRRDFLAASCAASLSAAALRGVQGGELSEAKDFIELRTYTCGTMEKKHKLVEILDTAGVPAWNRQGIKPVGVFYCDPDMNPGDKADPIWAKQVFVILPHKSLESIAMSTTRLLADGTFMQEAGALFETPMNDPIYDTFESALLHGFENAPKVEVPTTSPDRVLQLRIYNSYNIERNAKKIFMFDQGGELEIFRETGLDPVFFGETLFGDRMPNLTYMLSFENMDAKNANWKKFINHPKWKEISSDPQYKDTANKITNILLKPSNGSQI
jgi:hypothetical protein